MTLHIVTTYHCIGCLCAVLQVCGVEELGSVAQASLPASKQPRKKSPKQEAKPQGSGDMDEGDMPKHNAAEDDTMMAEMMKVDWKVCFTIIVNPLS